MKKKCSKCGALFGSDLLEKFLIQNVGENRIRTKKDINRPSCPYCLEHCKIADVPDWFSKGNNLSFAEWFRQKQREKE